MSEMDSMISSSLSCIVAFWLYIDNIVLNISLKQGTKGGTEPYQVHVAAEQSFQGLPQLIHQWKRWFPNVYYNVNIALFGILVSGNRPENTEFLNSVLHSELGFKVFEFIDAVLQYQHILTNFVQKYGFIFIIPNNRVRNDKKDISNWELKTESWELWFEHLPSHI